MGVMGLGLVLFFFGLDQPSATAPDPRLGNVLAAICAVTWAFTIIGYRWIVARGGSVATAAASGNLTACIVALVLAQPLAAGRPVDWAVVGFLGIFQLGVPYAFLTRAIPRLRALEVALFMLIEPVLNPIWAWLVHGERPGPATLLGGGLILGATVLRSVVDARSAPATAGSAEGRASSAVVARPSE
jgi:drug/metabolite transporter (DMT)-like permease